MFLFLLLACMFLLLLLAGMEVALAVGTGEPDIMLLRQILSSFSSLPHVGFFVTLPCSKLSVQFRAADSHPSLHLSLLLRLSCWARPSVMSDVVGSSRDKHPTRPTYLRIFLPDGWLPILPQGTTLYLISLLHRDLF